MVANLGGSEETVDFPDGFSVYLSLVLERSEEFAPTRIADGFGKVVVFNHA